MDPQSVVEGDHTMEGGMRAFAQLSTHRNRATAVMCSNDMTAIGVMRQAFDLGIGVPQELSIIGFDDTRLADFMIPPLTTIQMSQAELATLAFNALLKEVKREAPAPNGTEFVLKTQLILRNSTTFPSSNNQIKQPSTPKRISQPAPTG